MKNFNSGKSNIFSPITSPSLIGCVFILTLSCMKANVTVSSDKKNPAAGGTSSDPNAPTFTSTAFTTPASPNWNVTPSVTLSLSAAGTVTLYSDSNCVTAISDPTSVGASAGQSVAVKSIPPFSTTTIYGIAKNEAGLSSSCTMLTSYTQILRFKDPNPSYANQFGKSIIALSNGNVAIADPLADINGVTDCGAVYLFNGKTGALISTLYGSTANDQIGSTGLVALKQGNFVVVSHLWDNDTVVDAGAVTWVSQTTGLSGAVSSANSLVGSRTNDNIGTYYSSNLNVRALANGSYIVGSSNWDNGGATNAGAITWGNGSTGVSGAIDNTNSLVGTNSSDSLSSNGMSELPNGDYVAVDPYWNGSRGAVTHIPAATGRVGNISAFTSLIGSTANDQIGLQSWRILSNGNYVVRSPNWDNGATVDAGAVTWCHGSTGCQGTVSNTNSLVGTNANDRIGGFNTGIRALKNGTYVLLAPYWNGSRGIARFCGNAEGCTGDVLAADGLTGTSANDQVGADALALSNGNFVVQSSNWRNVVAGAGAVTWCSVTAAPVGCANQTVSAANSLVGTTTSEYVGSYGTALTNGNYVIFRDTWTCPAGVCATSAITNAGHVSWGNGATGSLVGTITPSNSLVGGSANDKIGSGWVQALSNGHYVIGSNYWNCPANVCSSSSVSGVGAVTWGNGTTGIKGNITPANSLVGSSTSDSVGSWPRILSDGNYVVNSPSWDNGSASDAGAITWVNGQTGKTGFISPANSLVGMIASDFSGANVNVLTNGNVVVGIQSWDCPAGVCGSSAVTDAGAAVWIDGTKGITGTIKSSNGLIGSSINDKIGSSIKALSNGHYFVESPNWNCAEGICGSYAVSKAGAITWGSGTNGVTGVVSPKNSLTGAQFNDQLSQGFSSMNGETSDGGYISASYLWGEVTPSLVIKINNASPSTGVISD